MKSITRWVSQVRGVSWLAFGTALAGGLVCFVKLWEYAHTQASFIDEGAFLVMGYQFIQGNYHPNQDYGPWMNYAPLSYIIPGAVQLVFGAGLLTGRYFSVVLALLAIVALWLTARRLAGGWWAACLVWAIAVTPYPLKVYSHVLSEVLVFFFLSWSLFFVLGEKRNLWQIVAGSLLAGLVVMTRHTMFPLLPLMVFYVFWQHGRKSGWWSLAGCMFPLVVIHAIYWPNILQMWSFYWLPTSWLPFLSQFKPITENFGSLYGSVDLRTQVLAFFSNFQANFIVLLGAITSLFLWPSRWEWKDPARKRAAIFLAILFFALLIIHAAGSLGFSACPFCFTPYTTFFVGPALLLVAVSFPFWRKSISVPLQVLAVILLGFISFGIGAVAAEQLGTGLLAVSLPRISNGIHLGQWVTLWDYVSNKLKLPYFDARVLVSIMLCLGIFFLVMCGILLIRSLLHRKGIKGKYSLGIISLLVFLGGGFIISPSLNAPYYECGQDVLDNYESIGRDLKVLIPAGSSLYWAGASSVPLSYLDDVTIHPAQVYGLFTYFSNPDDKAVEEAGYWNSGLDQLWFSQADFLIMEQDQLNGPLGLAARIDPALFDMTVLPPSNPCEITNPLLVFRRQN